MLSSRQPCGLHLGRDSHSTAAPLLFLACPLHPHPVSFGTAAQHSLGVPSLPLTPDRLLCVTTTTLSENVESGTNSNFLHQKTKNVARRRMTPSSSSNTTPTSTQDTTSIIPFRHTNHSEFTFRISPHPKMALTFPQRPSPPRSKKRCRAVADIDGEHSCTYKKKRRLRLFLITSRLSPQFSHPATNIVDRGNSKIAVWAKQKALGRNLLRKAAILNRIRRQTSRERGAREGMGRVLVEQEREQEQLRLAKLAFTYGSTDTCTRPVHKTPPGPPAMYRLRDGSDRSSSTPSRSPSCSPSPPLRALDANSPSEYRSPNDAYSYSPPLRAQSPRRSHLPLPPSPLGLSNYDAFDIEDDISDPYAHLDEEFELGHEDEDAREDTPFPFAAPTTTRPPISRTGSSEDSKTPPPQPIYSDFSMLDPDEPVFGDYDQVEEGADAIWPIAFVSNASPALPLSSSPDFPALFSTTPAIAAALSPNFAPTILDATQPTAPSMSPNFAPSSSESALSPTAASPNFGPVPNILDDLSGDGGTATTRAYQPKVIRRGSVNELEGEKERQRRYMFMQFGE